MLATALLACSSGLAQASQSGKRAALKSVTTSVSETVTTPGTYVVVVSVRARHRDESVHVYVAGQGARTIHASKRTAVKLRYRLKLTSAKLAVSAVSGAPAVRLSMKLILKKPLTTATATVVPPAPAPAPPPPAPAPAPAPTPPPLALNPYTHLAWSADFNGPAGAAPDPSKWTVEGNSGCGGSTPTTNSATNATLDGNGHLQLTGNANFSSAQIDTAGKFSMTPYGSVQASIQLPAGAGLCSAFWMVGDGANPTAGCWPGCGEIDMLEALGNLPNTAIFTLHGPTTNPAQQGNYQQFESAVGGFPDLTAGFHTYGVIWTPTSFTWTVDGVAYATETRAAMEAANGAGSWAGVYDRPFHIVLDVAVGNWQMGPQPSTPFPAKMLVNWVRVYQ